MKIIFAGLLIFIFGNFSAQNEVKFDSVLAKKLNADKYGMSNYILAILKTAPGDSVKGMKRDSLFAGHMSNMDRMVEQGALIVAGPIKKNDLAYRGIFVFNMSTIEEARKLCNTDPAIKAGIFTVELFEWYASAALQETIRIHKQIQKTE